MGKLVSGNGRRKKGRDIERRREKEEGESDDRRGKRGEGEKGGIIVNIYTVYMNIQKPPFSFISSSVSVCFNTSACLRHGTK